MASDRTIGDSLARARSSLQAHTDTPSLDAQLLMMKTLGTTRAWLMAHAEDRLSPDSRQAFEADVDRVAGGTALPYVVGTWEFFGRPFVVTPAVLIPRPETELLVSIALGWLEHQPEARRVADVGTGSGCVVASLALEFPAHHFLGVDHSWPALEVAARNLALYGLGGRVSLMQADLLTAASGPFDLLCANLPYIPSDRLPELPVSRREPTPALDGGPQGLAIVNRLVDQLPGGLAPGGRLLLELDPEQMAPVRARIRQVVGEARIETVPDLSGQPRVLVADRASAR
jgi:release factor glutamine methyltransferase